MKHIKTFENKQLEEEFLDTIFNAINNSTEEPIVTTVAGQFKFYLEENFPNKLTEYLYRISDGEDMRSVVLDMSKDMNRDDNMLYELVHAIFEPYKVVCIDDYMDGLNIDDIYKVTDEYVYDGEEYIELEENSYGEPITVYHKNKFEKLS